MSPGKTISLNRLTAIRRDEIDQMQQGIRGDAYSALWTMKRELPLAAESHAGRPTSTRKIVTTSSIPPSGHFLAVSSRPDALGEPL